MANKPEAISVPILPGMREDLDSALMPPGTPSRLQNVRCYQQGRLDKRPGTELLTPDGLSDDERSTWLSEQGGRAILGTQAVDGNDRVSFPVYGQQVAAAASSWTLLGAHGGVVPVRRFGISPTSSSSPKHVSCVRAPDHLYVSYTETSGAGTTTRLHVVALDGTVLRATTLENADNSRLLYINGDVLIVYRATDSSGADNIHVRVVDQTDASFGAAAGVASVGGNDFDVAPLEPTSTDWVIAYVASGTSITVNRMTGQSGVFATATIATVGTPERVGVAGQLNPGHVLVGWVEAASTVEVSFRNSNTLALVANHTLDTASGSEAWRYQVGFVRAGATSWWATFGGEESTSAPALQHAFFKFTSVSSGGSGSVAKVRHFGLASKPFISGDADGENTVYVWAHTQGDSTLWRSQASHFVLELTTSGAATQSDNVQLAALTYDHLATYGASTSFQAHLPSVADFGSGTFAAVLNWADPTLTGLDVAVFTAARRQDSVRGVHRFAAERAGALVVSGGCLYEHTGARAPDKPGYIVENGFAYEPELAVVAVAGGSMTSGQEYTYRAVYRWTDALGRVHRSAPSAPVTVTPSGADLSVTVRFPDLNVSGRSNSQITELVAEVYRSWLGGPYYLVTSAEAGSGTTETITDALSDSTVESRAVLYTDLGIMPTEPPSGARLWCDGGSRVFTVGWRENVVQFSKLLIPTAPIEFVDDDTFRIFLPEAITAIWYLDGALVVFCRRGVYLVTGDGPSDQGVGQYSDPRRLPVTVSCDDARSLLEVPQGLLFRGGGTIWLMPRGFAPPVPVGDAIQRQLAAFPYTVGVALTHKEGSEGNARCAHFVLSSSDVDASASVVVAVYDLEFGTWSIDDIGGPDVGAVAAIDGYFTWAAPDWVDSATVSPVRRLNATEFQDYDSAGDPLWITTDIWLGWIRPFGALGWGRISKVQLFGYLAGTCKVQLNGSVNDLSFTPVSKEFSTVQFSHYVEHAFDNCTGNSVQLNISDAIGDDPEAVPTAGYSPRAIAIEISPEPGLRRTSDQERF